MHDLNYHHLYYFWTIARAGSISRASAELGLTQPTISEQLGLLEIALGRKLFDRVGRSLVLTPAGDVAYRHAEQIFSLGRGLKAALSGKEAPAQETLRIFVDWSVDAVFVRLLLEPLAKKQRRAQLFIESGAVAEGFPKLIAGEFDLVLGMEKSAAQPFPEVTAKRLLQCGIVFLGGARSRAKFPRSLDGIPLLNAASAIDSQLRNWLRRHSVNPKFAGQVGDLELARQLAAAGWGPVVVPDIAGLDERHGLTVLGRTREVRMELYGFTAGRRSKNPVVQALLAWAGKRSR